MAGAAPRNGRPQQPDLLGNRPPSPRPASPRAAKPKTGAKPAAKPRAAGGGKPRRTMPAAFTQGMGWWDRLPRGARRGIAIGVIILILFVGFPVAHALFGEIGALLLLFLVGGFALGRATSRR
ncbi:hypothetical protein IAI18_16060 [Acetobacteraceae bacterium H6797]|nr:hypothetical protein [Acetobacteraceae bacterium H6797]